MAIQKKEFGVMPSGEKVYEYTLTNKSGVSASFIELGATWTKMLVPDRDGNMADVILGYDDLASYQVNTPHFGAPIGRNANRIGNAVITIDGKDYKLEANNGPNNLHSGPDLYHSRLWESWAYETAEGRRSGIPWKCKDPHQLYLNRGQLLKDRLQHGCRCRHSS